MLRSGTLLVLLFTFVGLAGCAATAPAGEGGSASPDPQASTRSCPEGFLDALTEHLAAPPDGGATEVSLIEEPAYAFRPDALNETVRGGCVFRVELESAAGDIMVQIFGVTSGADESQVRGILESAGWVQPFPDAEPGAYESEERDPSVNAALESVGVYAIGGSDFERAFPGWSDLLLDYFDATEMILQSVPTI